jgi:hypothetical protein
MSRRRPGVPQVKNASPDSELIYTSSLDGTP